ncbi:b44.1 [miniopterid betaherpesvirus 1]|uniref:B44.1 n=1 Tax=miniopterid betaherpesvirus 1 TaxID=3070189 RepID=I3VQ30_9BETA|nr:b44.1 [miniopterid betaherpesvirus 1]AFK83874.1 b44.1 [miniopterid betaherpesvirus 1]
MCTDLTGRCRPVTFSRHFRVYKIGHLDHCAGTFGCCRLSGSHVNLVGYLAPRVLWKKRRAEIVITKQ